METKQENAIEPFSNRLRKLRKERDWSQGQLAKKLNVDSQRISKYERALASPPLEMLLKIANAFDVSVDYLVRGKVNQSQNFKNTELIQRLEDIEELPHEFQQTLIIVLDSFIKRHKFEELAGR